MTFVEDVVHVKGELVLISSIGGHRVENGAVGHWNLN
jgi:hypothetical protein